MTPLFPAEIRWSGACPPGESIICKGSWDGWTSETMLRLSEDGEYVAELYLARGEHSYKLRVGREWVERKDRPIRPDGDNINNVIRVRPPVAVIHGGHSAHAELLAFLVIDTLKRNGVYAVAVPSAGGLECDVAMTAAAAVLLRVGGDTDGDLELQRAAAVLARRDVHVGLLLVSEDDGGAEEELRRSLAQLVIAWERLPWPRGCADMPRALTHVLEVVLRLLECPPVAKAAPKVLPAPVSTPSRRRGNSPARRRTPAASAPASPVFVAASPALFVPASPRPAAPPAPPAIPVPVLATSAALRIADGVVEQAVRFLQAAAGPRFDLQLRPCSEGASAARVAVLLGTGTGPRVPDDLVEALAALRKGSKTEVVLVILRNTPGASLPDYTTAGPNGAPIPSGLLNCAAPQRAVLRLAHYEGRLEEDLRSHENARTLASLLSAAATAAGPEPARAQATAPSAVHVTRASFDRAASRPIVRATGAYYNY